MRWEYTPTPIPSTPCNQGAPSGSYQCDVCSDVFKSGNSHSPECKGTMVLYENKGQETCLIVCHDCRARGIESPYDRSWRECEPV